MRLRFLSKQEKAQVSNDIKGAQATFRAALKAALHAQQQKRYSDAFLQAGAAFECSRLLALQQRDAHALQRYGDTALLMRELLLTLGFDELVEPFVRAFNRDKQTIDTGDANKGLLGLAQNNQRKRLTNHEQPTPYRRRCYRRAGLAG